MTKNSVWFQIVWGGLVVGTCLVSPATAKAQFGWPSSWNPWKQEGSAAAAPEDPFAERRGSGQPQYQTATLPSRPSLSQPISYPPAGAAQSGQAATMSISDTPAMGPSYPGTQAANAGVGSAYSVPGNSYPAADAYPANNSYPVAGGYPAANAYSGYSATSTQPMDPYASSGAPAMPPNYQAMTPPQSGYQVPSDVSYVTNLPQQPAPANENDLFKPARIVAIVNGEPILAGDVLGPVNQMIQQRMESLTEEQRATVREEDLEQFKQQALKQMLPGLIDVKIVYLEFLRNVPSDRRGDMETMLAKNYYEHQLEADLKDAGVQTRAELDMELRKIGSSLEKKKQRFVEQVVAFQQIQRHVKSDEEVTHLQMLDYYNEHSSEYEKPARAKWEQLMVKFSEFPNRQAAWEAIAGMGNRVLRGAPLDAVAKRESQGIRASRGGQYDWTSKGSLKNETVDQAIFSLPIGELSPILESPEGFHIVRVTDREDAGMVPFTKAQVEIKEQIKKERKQREMAAYIKEVKSKAQVWTIFDNDQQNEPPR
ncbi:peptidyl-prolyl cis-trans isomerase [Blastopirellula marina]|uniref:peptidyl-prolyl cis-trans isomerase n=1 Tax=Blastopirellula marina TaxID=124 RepID=UPI0013048265|nr:peptidyl-prolyl cis-trans isomerase [Blastopirellula marina]